MKNIIRENNKDSTIIHLFNTSFNLDKNELKNLPIGLYGNFYNQHLTFFLIPENDLKNIKLVFKESNINVERVFLKNFVGELQNVKKLSQDNKNICIINIGKQKSNISIFQDRSFVFSENFQFGSDIIIKDISTLCSLKLDVVQNILNDTCFDELELKTNETFLDSNYFEKNNYRKVSYNHLLNIISARMEEVINLIYNGNINLKNFYNNKMLINLKIEDPIIFNSLKNILANQFNNNNKLLIELSKNIHFNSCSSAAEIFALGWEKEAISVIDAKKTFISKVFEAIFK